MILMIVLIILWQLQHTISNIINGVILMILLLISNEILLLILILMTIY